MEQRPRAMNRQSCQAILVTHGLAKTSLQSYLMTVEKNLQPRMWMLRPQKEPGPHLYHLRMKFHRKILILVEMTKFKLCLR
ncbi:unnamed protein product [Camellia sinensis]